VNEKLKGIEMERTEEFENERKESFDLQFQARYPVCSKFRLSNIYFMYTRIN
jgi:hypothetical protein